MFSSEFLENSECVCLSCSLYLIRHLTMCLVDVYKILIQWINVDSVFIISEKCFLPLTDPSSLYLERTAMVLNLSFCCYHRENSSHCSGICKLPFLHLPTNFYPHSLTTFLLYFIETNVHTLFYPPTPSRISLASISFFFSPWTL